MADLTEVYCSNCREFRSFELAANDATCFDVVCAECRWIVATMREPRATFDPKRIASQLRRSLDYLRDK